jgi:hypothetical protein
MGKTSEKMDRRDPAYHVLVDCSLIIEITKRILQQKIKTF